MAQKVLRPFSVKEFHRMVEARILQAKERVELLNGEILEMPPIGSPHAACVGRLNFLFSFLFRQEGSPTLFTVRIQDPIQLDDFSEPQPDVALVHYRLDFYEGGHPDAEQTYLIVEVAHSTLAPDRRHKVPDYARAGIPEVWVVDLEGSGVEAYRKPSPGGYEWMQRYHRGERLAPEAFPELELSVDQILG